MTTQAFRLLEATRDLLGALPGVQTSRIGLEATITPADYPIVRIVPSRLRHSEMIGLRAVEVLVYFGRPVHEFTGGNEALYEALFDLEAAIVEALEGSEVRGRYIETIADEERVAGYRLMAVRATVEG